MRTPEAHSTRRTLSPARTIFAVGTIPARNAFPAHEWDYTPLRELAWNEDYQCAVRRPRVEAE